MAKVDDELVLRRPQLKPVPGLQELTSEDTVMLLTDDDDSLIQDIVVYVLTDMAGLAFNQARHIGI